MSEKFVEGEVWINGAKTTAELSPYICEYGFWLWNHSGGSGGPHISINIYPAALDAYIGDGAKQIISASIESPNIGQIDECRGYAAADVGLHTRLIEALKMNISRNLRSTKFCFEGKTGMLTHNSVAGGLGDEERRLKGIYSFKVWFVIPDSEMETYFKSHQALAAIRRFAEVDSN